MPIGKIIPLAVMMFYGFSSNRYWTYPSASR